MAMHGTRNHGGRSATAATNAKMPQANTSTQIGTTIFCAASMPTRFAARSNATSNKILFHCFAMYSPGACPFSINCASQALYTWLARSPASMRRCHQHGTRINAEIANAAVICHPENRERAVRLLLCSVKFSAKRRPRFSTSRCAAFYYLPLAADAYPELLGDLPRKRRGTHQERSKLNATK